MSFLNRRVTRSLGRFIILMLLFGQSLSVALPCQMPDQTAAMAFEDMGDMDCAQKGNPNACLQQYVGADQSTSHHVQAGIADVSQIAVLIVQLPDIGAALPVFRAASLAHSPDPPPSIRFCSFQI
jgi:hypothetical protein